MPAKKRSKSPKKTPTPTPISHEQLQPDLFSYVTRAQYDSLRTEHLSLQSRYNSLELALMEADRGHGVASAYLQRELQRKDDEVQRLKQENSDLQTTVQNHQEAVNQAVSQARKSFESESSSLHENIQSLQDKIKELYEFKENKQRYDDEMRAAREGVEAYKSELREQIEYLETSFMKSRAASDKQHTEEVTRLQEASKLKAESILRQLYREMVEQNAQLANDLKFHVAQNSELENRAEKAEKKLNDLLTERWSQGTLLEGQSKKGMDDDARIKNLTQKIKELERQLSTLINKAESARKQEVGKLQALLEEMTLENEALKKLVRLKAAKLFKIKAIAEHVVSNRSDVERFFLDCLVEIRSKLSKSESPTVDDSVFLTQSRDTDDDNLGRLSSVLLEDFDFSSLNWNEKEKIITKLIRKMNENLRVHSRSSSTLPPIYPS
ncbi:hypothetical protein RCL1_003728 [Eukaryota sp. TZLM3-RCL]